MKSLIILFVTTLVLTVSASAQREGGQNAPSPEKMAQMMTEKMKKDLSLSDEQAKEMYDIALKGAQERMKHTGSQKLTQEQSEAKRSEMDAKIKSILSKEQYDKWQEMRKNFKNKKGDKR